jgi:hypothetical protein
MIKSPEQNVSVSRAASPSPLLTAKLDGLRRKHVSVAALTGLSMAVAVSIELLALAMFADWWLELSWSARFVSLAVQAGLLAAILVRQVARPIVRQPDGDSLALMVEKARPEFHSRLIAAIQLTRPGAIPPGASVVLADATVEQTEAFAAPFDFNRIVPTGQLKKLGALALAVLLIGSGALLAGGATPLDLLKRAFLSNISVPRKTRVSVIEGNKIVGIGDNVRLEALVDGIIPTHGKVEISYRSRRTQEFPLE